MYVGRVYAYTVYAYRVYMGSAVPASTNTGFSCRER